MPRYLYSTPVKTITEVVEELMLVQGNYNGNHYLALLKHAQRVWQDLHYTNQWNIVQKALQISDARTITLPQNVARLIGINVVDKHGIQQPLLQNPYINTLDIRCPQKDCSCKCGGKGTLCSEADNLEVTTEVLNINGDDYTKTVYTRRDSVGNVYRESHTPVWNGEDVEMIDDVQLLCSLDLTETGCVAYTEPNRRRLVEFCGCHIPLFRELNCLDGCGLEFNNCPPPVAVKPDYSPFGYFNWDAIARNVIHIKDSKAVTVIVIYQTNGETENEEILIPDYAVDAMLFGIRYKQAAFARRMSIVERKQLEYDYNAAKNRLWEFQNPVKINEFRNLQERTPKW